jgi:hypothetical protein
MKIDLDATGARLEVELFGYENEAATNPPDANWIQCLITVNSGGFGCTLHASITTYDFAALQRELNGCLSGNQVTAKFETHEEALQFEITMSEHGRGTLIGVAKQCAPRAQLVFELDLDWPSLKKLADQVALALLEFPIKE